MSTAEPDSEPILSIPFPRGVTSPSHAPVACSDAEVVECLWQREAVIRRALVEQRRDVAEAARHGLPVD
jgi:hypothetical protein